MTSQNPYLKSVFPQPPLVTYKRQKNIRDFLIRAKVPPPLKPFPKRQLNGVKKCNKPWMACPYIKEGKTIKLNNKLWKITNNINCETKNIIYLIECNIDTCKMRYIGESERKLRERLSDHRSYINNNMKNKATGHHFNLPGHSIDNITITVIEKVRKDDILYRREREKFYIRKFNTYYNGMNRQP